MALSFGMNISTRQNEDRKKTGIAGRKADDIGFYHAYFFLMFFLTSSATATTMTIP